MQDVDYNVLYETGKRSRDGTAYAVETENAVIFNQIKSEKSKDKRLRKLYQRIGKKDQERYNKVCI